MPHRVVATAATMPLGSRAHGRGHGRGRGRGRGRGHPRPARGGARNVSDSGSSASSKQGSSRGGRRKRKRGAMVSRQAFAVDGKLDHKTLCWLAGLPPDKRGPAEANARMQAGLDNPDGSPAKKAHASAKTNKHDDVDLQNSNGTDAEENGEDAETTTEQTSPHLRSVLFSASEASATQSSVCVSIDDEVIPLAPFKRKFLEEPINQTVVGSDTLLNIQSRDGFRPSALRKTLRKFMAKCLRADKSKISLRPVQARCWQASLSGRNAVVVAPTGSGKTLAYLTPLIPHVLDSSSTMSAPIRNMVTKSPPSPFHALILAPTRELVTQICAVGGPHLRRLHSIRMESVTGGVDINSQLQVISEMSSAAADAVKVGESVQPAILVATPGRLVDLLTRGALRLFSVTCVVIDEADRMLKMGLREQVDTILGQIRPDKQTVLCSATEVTNIFYRKQTIHDSDDESQTQAIEDIYRSWLRTPFTGPSSRDSTQLDCLAPENTSYIRIAGGDAVGSKTDSKSSSAEEPGQTVLTGQGDDRSKNETAPTASSGPSNEYDHTINVNINQVRQPYFGALDCCRERKMLTDETFVSYSVRTVYFFPRWYKLPPSTKSRGSSSDLYSEYVLLMPCGGNAHTEPGIVTLWC